MMKRDSKHSRTERNLLSKVGGVSTQQKQIETTTAELKEIREIRKVVTRPASSYRRK